MTLRLDACKVLCLRMQEAVLRSLTGLRRSTAIPSSFASHRTAHPGRVLCLCSGTSRAGSKPGAVRARGGLAGASPTPTLLRDPAPARSARCFSNRSDQAPLGEDAAGSEKEGLQTDCSETKAVTRGGESHPKDVLLPVPATSGLSFWVWGIRAPGGESRPARGGSLAPLPRRQEGGLMGRSLGGTRP